MDLCELTAVSPIDGRYAAKTADLREIFSEFGLIRRRIQVEVRWLEQLAGHPGIREVAPLSNEALQLLNRLVHRVPIDETHRIECIAVGSLADAVKRNHAGMFKPRGDFGFEQKTIAADRVRRQVSMQKLDRNFTMSGRVVADINGS